MRQPTVMWSVIVVLLSVCLGAAVTPTSVPNVGQVDVNVDPNLSVFWACPPGSSTMVKGPFTDVPGLSLSLTTSGNPVLVLINMTLHGVSGAGFYLDFVIDGVPQSNDRMAWQTSADSEIELFSLQRVYAVAAAAHTFSAKMSCQNELLVYRAWLTVYELPPVKAR